jgi:NAD(P)-dependent dehydrogenase (short-subunit alcohol dehydrogenase family)
MNELSVAKSMIGRRAVISGGANGLGAATAVLFAQHGASVVIADLPGAEPAAREVISQIEAEGQSAWFVPMNVRDGGEVQAGVAQAVELMGGIDAVVASAGVAAFPGTTGRDLLNMSAEHFDFVMDINLNGVFRVVQACAQRMVLASGGSGGTIVTLASMAAKRPTAGPYSVSKSAVWMLTRCFAQELGSQKVRVNAIGPGYVETDLFNNMVVTVTGDDETKQANFRAVRKAQAPLGEFPNPEDIAQTALFLSTDASRMFTGSILHPDGGFTSAFGGG